MIPAKPEALQAARAALKAMRADETIKDDATYGKLMVMHAYEWVAIQEIGTAVEVLRELPLSYFQEIQPGQMDSDRQFRDISYLVAHALVVAGVVDLGPKIVPTQAEAKA